MRAVLPWLFGLAGLALALGCGDGELCDKYPNLCAGAGGTPAQGGGPPGSGETGGDGGGEACSEACVAGDENTTAACVDGDCVYTCAADYASCDEDETTCEVLTTVDGNCGGCNVECAYDECKVIDDVYACNDPIDIAAGDNHTCAIKKDGTIWCWGLNNYGQLGTGSRISLNTTPVIVAGLPDDFRASFQSHDINNSCTLSSDNQLACWGYPANSTGVAQMMTGEGIELLTTFDTSGLAILEPDQKLVAFGFNPSAGTVTFPIAAPGAGVAVAASEGHRCFILADSTLKCWGQNAFGQTGNGDTTIDPVMLPHVIDVDSFQEIGTGEEHTCALSIGGVPYCWGRNTTGALAATNGRDSTPTPFPSLVGAEALAVGPRHNAFIRNDTLYVFGDNDGHQSSPNDGDVADPTPYALLPGDTPRQIALGLAHTCVLMDSGLLRCWGENSSGQLGNGGNSDSPAPVMTMF